MKRPSRRSLWLGALAIGAASAYWLLPESEPARARRVLERAAELVRHPGGLEPATLAAELSETFAEGAVLHTAELPPVPAGPAGIGQLIERARERFTRLRLDLGTVQLRLDAGATAATAQTDAVLTLEQPGVVREEPRKLTARLIKGDSGWKIVALNVAAKTFAEPEERP